MPLAGTSHLLLKILSQTFRLAQASTWLNIPSTARVGGSKAMTRCLREMGGGSTPAQHSSCGEGTQALFCSDAEQCGFPLTCISPPSSYSVHGNVRLSCQQLGLCSPDPFPEQLCTTARSLFPPPGPSRVEGHSSTHLLPARGPAHRGGLLLLPSELLSRCRRSCSQGTVKPRGSWGGSCFLWR